MKVLAIDDQPEVLKQIEKAIADAEGPDGKPYDVVALTDHLEAFERLDAEHFDVVITDMVMGADQDEGLAILHKLSGQSPITIVLTAYPSIPNCVEAMRAGAWDYLEKVPADGSDAYENLLRSLADACRFRAERPEHGLANPDAKWVHEHFAELLDEYGGEVIAVLYGKVVDHDKDYRALRRRVAQEYAVARPMLVSVPDTKVEAVE
jgi:DNA-binding NtrC family response regulator